MGSSGPIRLASESMTIVPDDKDWTWVLERPCPACGFDATDVAPQNVPTLISDLAIAWEGVLLGTDVGQRPDPLKWSPLEYACHVRDVLRIFDERLKLMVAQDGAHFANWDQDVTAVEERYDLQDPIVVSRELAEASEALALHFSLVMGPQWAHRGLRSNGSEFTVSTFAVYLTHDLVHHLWDVSVG